MERIVAALATILLSSSYGFAQEVPKDGVGKKKHSLLFGYCIAAQIAIAHSFTSHKGYSTEAKLLLSKFTRPIEVVHLQPCPIK